MQYVVETIYTLIFYKLSTKLIIQLEKRPRNPSFQHSGQSLENWLFSSTLNTIRGLDL